MTHNDHHPQHHRFWFKPKRYGYGFVPVTWEGWLATLVLVACILAAGFVNGVFEEQIDTKGVIQFIINIILISAVWTLYAVRRMREPLRWRWGSNRKK